MPKCLKKLAQKLDFAFLRLYLCTRYPENKTTLKYHLLTRTKPMENPVIHTVIHHKDSVISSVSSIS